ncbi:MAG: hypothetical protein QM611_06545, partial [Microbacterium sp.]|uniref:hypothetical protein n=1 Tax=Microbacterium sp. TaxID=51671 RepID=UPI0039E69434
MSTPRTVPFDPRPLVEPVDPAAARAFTRELRATGQMPSSGGNVIGAVLLGVFGLFFVSIFLTVGGGFISMFVSQLGRPLSWALLPMMLMAVLICGGVVVVIVFLIRNIGVTHVRRYRLHRFARANGMSYLPVLDNPPLPGMIFSVGSSRTSADLVRGEHPRFVEFANYSFETGSGKETTTHRWGYVAVKLNTPLPHIVLDALSNNGLFGASNLPASFDKGQRLSLEGDFDRYFALYCPRGYERDALYLFTPDIMARFIDNAAALDVEIVDDWLFLYAQRNFATLDPATWAWLFSVVGALLDKLAQWERWRDERMRPAMDAAAPAAGAAAAAAELPFA